MSESQPPERPSEDKPEVPEDTPETPEGTPEAPEATPEAPREPETPDADQSPEESPAEEGAYSYTPPPPHPVRLVVYDDLKRSRLTVFFRFLLLIPHFLWIYAWIFQIMFLVFINWFAVLIRARSPEDLHLVLARALRYWTHVNSYWYLTSNPYPHFFGRPGDHPNDLEIEGPDRQRRVITLFRLILAIPAYVIAYVFSLVRFFIAIIGWFIAVVIGRMPKGMRDLSAYCLQYEAQTYAYVMLLTDRYPSFTGPRS